MIANQSIEQQLLIFKQESWDKKVTRFGEQTLAWLALLPTWSRNLAIKTKLPTHGDSLDIFLEKATKYNLVERSSDGENFWMPDAQRNEVLDRLSHRSSSYLSQEAAELGHRVKEVFNPQNASSVVHRWAMLASKLESDAPLFINAATWLDKQIQPHIDTNETGAALAWIETGKEFALLFGGNFETAVRLWERRLEIVYRRERDKRFLDSFLERQEQIAAFNDLLKEDTSFWALHYLGMGGVGKTMLLRYIAADLANEKNFITSRIDFDYINPDFPARKPAQLFFELADEFGIPGSDVSQRLRTKGQYLHEILSSNPLTSDPVAQLMQPPLNKATQEMIESFIDLLKATKRKVVLILDTCEELAKYQPSGTRMPSVEVTFYLLEQVHALMPSVRIVFAGRRLLTKAGYNWEIDQRQTDLVLALLPEKKDYLALHTIKGFTGQEAKRFVCEKKDTPITSARTYRAALTHSREIGITPYVCFASPNVSEVSFQQIRYNPFDLNLFANWLIEDPDLTVERLSSGQQDLYIERRILDRLRPELRRLLPAVSVLGRFNETMLDPILSRDSKTSQTLFRELGEQEWIVSHRDEQLNTIFLSAQPGLLSRLREYYSRDENHRQQRSAAKDQLAPWLDGCVRTTRLEKLATDIIDNALRINKNETAARLWSDIENRIPEEADWGWARNVILRLLGTDGAIDTHRHPLRAGIEATLTASLIHLEPDHDPRPNWTAVTAGIERYPDEQSRLFLKQRALAGRIAAIPLNEKKEFVALTGVADLKDLLQNSFFPADLKSERSNQLTASYLAAFANVVDAVEEYGYQFLNADINGILADFAHRCKKAQIHSDLHAFAYMLAARARALQSRSDQIDSLLDDAFEAVRSFSGLEQKEAFIGVATTMVEAGRIDETLDMSRSLEEDISAEVLERIAMALAKALDKKGYGNDIDSISESLGFSNADNLSTVTQAEALLRVGRVNEAQKAALTLVGPWKSLIMAQVVKAMIAEGRFDEALEVQKQEALWHVDVIKALISALIKENRGEEAVEIARSLSYPEHVDALVTIAQSLSIEGQVKEALKIVKDFSTTDRKDTLEKVIRAAEDKGHIDQALIVAGSASQKWRTEIQLTMTKVLAQAGHIDRASELLSSLPNLERVEAMATIAIAMAMEGDISGAQNQLRKFGQMWRPAIRLAIVIAMVEQGEIDKALTEAQSLDGFDRTSAMESVVQALIDQGRIDMAREVAQLLKGDGYAKAMATIAKAMVNQEDFSEAQRTAQGLDSPWRAEAMTTIARAMIEQGHIDEALQEAEELDGHWQTKVLNAIANAVLDFSSIDQVLTLSQVHAWKAELYKAIARALANRERIDEALAIARRLEGPWRAKTLATVARVMIQANQDDISTAKALFKHAASLVAWDDRVKMGRWYDWVPPQMTWMRIQLENLRHYPPMPLDPAWQELQIWEDQAAKAIHNIDAERLLSEIIRIRLSYRPLNGAISKDLIESLPYRPDRRATCLAHRKVPMLVVTAANALVSQGLSADALNLLIHHRDKATKLGTDKDTIDATSMAIVEVLRRSRLLRMHSLLQSEANAPHNYTARETALLCGISSDETILNERTDAISPSDSWAAAKLLPPRLEAYKKLERAEIAALTDPTQAVEELDQASETFLVAKDPIGAFQARLLKTLALVRVEQESSEFVEILPVAYKAACQKYFHSNRSSPPLPKWSELETVAQSIISGTPPYTFSEHPDWGQWLQRILLVLAVVEVRRSSEPEQSYERIQEWLHAEYKQDIPLEMLPPERSSWNKRDDTDLAAANTTGFKFADYGWLLGVLVVSGGLLYGGYELFSYGVTALNAKLPSPIPEQWYVLLPLYILLLFTLFFIPAMTRGLRRRWRAVQSIIASRFRVRLNISLDDFDKSEQQSALLKLSVLPSVRTLTRFLPVPRWYFRLFAPLIGDVYQKTITGSEVSGWVTDFRTHTTTINVPEQVEQVLTSLHDTLEQRSVPVQLDIRSASLHATPWETVLGNGLVQQQDTPEPLSVLHKLQPWRQGHFRYKRNAPFKTAWIKGDVRYVGSPIWRRLSASNWERLDTSFQDKQEPLSTTSPQSFKLLHVVGTPIQTSAGVRLQVSDQLKDGTRLASEHFSGDMEETRSGTILSARELPLAVLMVIQENPSNTFVRSRFEREQVALSKMFAAEICEEVGPHALWVVPALPPSLASAVLNTIATGLPRKIPDLHQLLEITHQMRVTIATWKGQDNNLLESELEEDVSLDLSLDVCLYFVP